MILEYDSVSQVSPQDQNLERQTDCSTTEKMFYSNFFKKILYCKQYRIFFFVFVSIIGDLSAQEKIDNWNVFIEKNNQKLVEKNPYYVDSYPDTLYYYNNMRFLFRQSPLSLQPGYSNVYNHNEVYLEIVTGSGNEGKKGYIVTWIIRNDSLFIQRVHPQYRENSPSHFLPDDTITMRMEKFTGKRFKNGLLFVNWITGDLRVVTRHVESRWLSKFSSSDVYGEYTDDRKYGSVLTVHEGLIIALKDDMTDSMKNNILKRERDYEIVRNSQPFYIDAEPDILYHDGTRYYFRQSPLSIKQGYTDVFHEDEVSIFNVAETSMGGGIMGLKGYHLAWVTRNDSLFISDVNPTYYDPKHPTFCKDTIMARMEAFTGGRFVNGLLFIDWISKDLGIMTKYIRRIADLYDLDSKSRVFTDDRQYGKVMSIKKGLVIGFGKDTRDIKN